MGKHLILQGRADGEDTHKDYHEMIILQVLSWNHHYPSLSFFLHVTLKIRLKVAVLVNSGGRIRTQACLVPGAPAPYKHIGDSQMSSIPYHILDFS